MRLWIARHATPLVAAGLCYGALDVQADEQATLRAAQSLAQVLPHGIAVFSSPLRRCRQLADALQALRPDLAHWPDPRLREMDFGLWEGRPWDSITAAAMQAWTDDFEHHRPGGGESVSDFMQRVEQAWHDTLEAGSDAAWITHAGVIRAVTLLQSGALPVTHPSQWPSTSIPYGHWERIDLPQDRA